ncbi:uncharacterized protein LOC141852838 isoform X2 [Brevipalpus obovatus]
MAALISRTGNKTFCGATLISERYLVTAAHCVINRFPSSMRVRLGAYDFSDNVDPNAIDYAVKNFRIHGAYDSKSYRNDIAIITLKQEVPISSGAIRPICLPDARRTFFGREAIVAGWGAREFGGDASKKLRQVSVPIWNNTACQSSYNLDFINDIYCAGYPQGGRDACQGDSGGPLMLQGAEGRWQLVGIVSFGFRCGQPNFPGVYTRVSSHMDWIAQETSDSPSGNLNVDHPQPTTPKPPEPSYEEESVESTIGKLKAKAKLLKKFYGTIFNGKVETKRLLDRTQAIIESRQPSSAEMELISRQIDEMTKPPSWFMKKTELCFQWTSNGNEQCYASEDTLCASPNSFTSYFTDNTDGRGSCRMRWAIINRSADEWFKKVEICRQWYSDGDTKHCNGGKGQIRCAKLGNYTENYIDSTGGPQTNGCLLSWSLKVPTNAPVWGKNLGICMNYLGDSEQCSSESSKLTLCAFANKWTEYYRDNTNASPGGCQIAWGIFTADEIR